MRVTAFKLLLTFLLFAGCQSKPMMCYQSMPIMSTDDLFMASLARIPVDSLMVDKCNQPTKYIDSGTVIDSVALCQTSVVVTVPRMARAIAYKIQLDSLVKIDSSIKFAVKSNQDTVLKRDSANAEAFYKTQQYIQKHDRDFLKGTGLGFVLSALLAAILTVTIAIAGR